MKGFNNLVKLDDNVRGLNNLELNMDGNQSFIVRSGTNFMILAHLKMRLVLGQIQGKKL